MGRGSQVCSYAHDFIFAVTICLCYLGRKEPITAHCTIELESQVKEQEERQTNQEEGGQVKKKVKLEDEGQTNQEGGQVGQEYQRGKGKRKVDITKDDFFMAIAKLATTQSTSETKVQSLN